MTEGKRYSLKAGTHIGEWDLSLPLDPEVRQALEGMKMNETLAALDEEQARIDAESTSDEEVGEEAPTVITYADMDNRALIAEAKTREGLKITGKPTREDLIKLLEEDDAKEA